MAKNRLVVDYQYNFVLLALNANVKPHKLAWAINNELKLGLIREPNMNLEFTRGRSLSIINFMAETEHQTVRLILNKSENINEQYGPFLIPELKNFDYLLVLENESNTFDENAFINNTKQIPFVQFAIKVDLQTLKSRDNLIF